MDSQTVVKIACLSSAFAAGAAVIHLYHSRRQGQYVSPAVQTLDPPVLLAAVELGGTSCRAAVAYSNDPATLVEETEVKTADPKSTLSHLVEFLGKHAPFAALGVASFGPIDMDPVSETYGYITTTPKLGWKNVNVLGHFQHFRVPIGFDTDVNAPALAELKYGGHVGDSCAYITVGTGIGVGLVVGDRPIHGLVHPEGGHVMVRRRENDEYKGWADIHPGSVESMASARACAERAGVEPTDLANLEDDNPVWDEISYYLAQLCITVCYIASPHVIVMSGGVMKRKILFDKIRSTFKKLNEGYIAADRVIHHLDDYIVPSKYGNNIGIIGAVELARRAAVGLK